MDLGLKGRNAVVLGGTRGIDARLPARLPAKVQVWRSAPATRIRSQAP